MSYKRACMAAGIDQSTFYRWLQKAEKHKRSKYSKFRKRLQAAEAEGELANLQAIIEAGKRDWRARAWLLERRHPERWGKREFHEGSGPGEPIRIVVEYVGDQGEAASPASGAEDSEAGDGEV
jgi:hypothetical protein